ncbi:T9SS type A sorting domain-containing protein [bacterium]|nr:T9SS type A sorting domain-containing protein [bacterium]
MKRLGSYLAILTIVLFAAAGTATADPEWVPNIIVPDDSSVVFCTPDSICFQVAGYDEDANDTLRLLIIQPDGERVFETYDTNEFTRDICFEPDTAGIYTWKFKLRDRYDRWVEDSVSYTVSFNDPPTIVCPQPQTFYTCEPDSFCFTVDAMDPEFGELTLNILSGNASIDGKTVCVFGSEDAQFDVMIEVVDECGHADTCTVPVTIEGNRPPVVSLPQDFSISLCNGEEICVPGAYADDPDFDLESVFTNFGYYDNAGDRVCFTADTTGIYTLTLTAIDSCGAQDTDTILVDVTVTAPPVISLGDDRTIPLCDPGDVCLEDIVIDGDIDQLMISFGQYDAEAGTICFTPDTAGVYEIIAYGSDQCEREVADTVLVTVELNSPPVIASFPDTSLYLCSPQQVCIDADIFDVDGDIVSVVSSIGQYTDGRICFYPYAKGQYEIVLTVTDACDHVVQDTAYVTISTDQDINLVCPGDTTVFLCDPDTLRFPIEGIPANAEITVGGTNAQWDPETNSIWFYSDCCLENELTVYATTECGTYSCSFTVYVETNSPPLVALPQDTSIVGCDPQDICLPVGISDIDGNIESVVVSGVEGAYYDDYHSTICFSAEQSGTYTLGVTVTDSCGEVRSNSVDVTVHLNESPELYVEYPSMQLIQCEPEEICVPFENSDDGSVQLTATLGEIRETEPGQGELCFTPEMIPAYFTILLTATDDCGVADSVLISIEIEQGQSTEIVCPIVEPASLCDTATLTVPVEIVGTTDDVRVSYGEWTDGVLSFLADTAGTYTIDIISVARCNSDTCQLVIPVSITDPVEIVCPEDTSFFFCESPQTISFPVTINGVPDDVTVLPETASLVDGILSMNVSESGDYEFMIIAANACNTDTCSFTATVNFNVAPAIVLADDTTITLCELPAEIRFPYHVINPDDGLIEVRTTLGIVNDSIIRFNANSPGVYEMIVSATDDCGLVAKDTAHITIIQGETVTLECPTEPIAIELVVPETVRVPLAVSPADADVTVSNGGSYDAETGELVLPIENYGTTVFDVLATSPCGEQSCQVTVNAEEYFPPMVFCPEDVDTALCESLEPQTICLPLTVSGNYTGVDVSPIGSFVDGEVCIPVDTVGIYEIAVKVYNDRDTASCSFTLTNREGALPSIDLAAEQSAELCGPDTICVPYTITAGDFAIESITPTGGVLSDGNLCVAVDTTGTYVAGISVIDSCGNEVTANVTITVDVNQPPVVELPEDFDFMLCGPDSEICFDVAVSDVNLYSVTSSMGTYDSETGQVCFTPEGPGDYTITVTAIDSCETIGSDEITITVMSNSAPTVSINPSDTTIFMCNPIGVCLDVAVDDIDGNIASVTTNRGSYNDGKVCFFPYSMGTYRVIVTVTDECGEQAVDTATVVVQTEQGLSLTCPGDTSVFLCEPDTLRFPIEGIPAGAEITLRGTNVHWDETTNSVWFYSDCCIENTIRVIATTECGSYICEFTVYVQTNSAPLVTLPQDTSVVQCETAEICIPVGISDIDDNLQSVELNDATFSYSAYDGTICFTPDSAGLYTIAVTATDECGAQRTTDMTISVVTNRPPTVAFEGETTEFTLCDLEQICLPIDIDDPDFNITGIAVSPSGVFNGEAGTICFTPEQFGDICIAVTATDDCGLQATDTLCVSVMPIDSVRIACPEQPVPITLCDPGDVCIPLEITGENFAVETSFGSWVDGELCFPGDTSGTYTMTVTASGECNTEQCLVTVVVDIIEPLTLTCPGNAEEFLCGPDTLCYEFSVAASVETITALGGAFINGNQVCVPVLEPGQKTITITAANGCDTLTCSFTIQSTFNTPPVVVEQQDISVVECSLEPICLPYAVDDIDGNIVSITGPDFGEITDEGFCFTPSEFGSYEIIITATDECGAVDIGSYTYTITEGDYALIGCPDDPYVSICGASRICVPIMIEPAGAEVTILPASYNGSYDPEEQTICLDMSEGGAHAITVIAAAQCSSDTCHFTVNVDLQQPPVLTCPGEIDTLLCLAEPTELCFPVGVEGTGVEVTVLPAGQYSAGEVCIPVDTAGVYELTIIGNGTCGVDTCMTTVTVTADELPVITLPEFMSFERCPEDEESICIEGFSASDTESDVTLTMTCGPGDFNESTGTLCFVPDSLGMYEFCFEATDGCHTVTTTYQAEITLRPDCDVCVRLSIDGGACTPVNMRKRVAMNIETNDEIGGFDILISYDASAMTFVGATTTGSDADDWEYFHYSLNNAACGSACPSGLVRFIGIADQNDGGNHPPESAYSVNGTLFYMEYLIANDQNLGNNFVPIRFVWYDCGDNSVSNRTGQILFVDLRIFNAEGILVWDEDDDVTYPESARQFGVGAEDACIDQSDKAQPLRCIEFYHGGVCIIDPDEIDDRGDINLNAISYEIADVVTFTNYFVYGLSAFTINIAGQTAASDVNADGLTLTVADLVYLIRVVVGDAFPIPKTNPYADAMDISTESANGLATVSTDAVSTIGGLHLVYDIPSGMEVDVPSLAAAADGMKFDYGISGNELRVVIYDIGHNMIAEGRNTILTIPYSGSGELTLVKSDAADYFGQPYTTRTGSALPDGFALNQNYPNPFNPSTTISFDLPAATGWRLEVFNVTGAAVRSYEGSAVAGAVQVVWDGCNERGEQVASGVYLYRLQAGTFTETKKMMLLK